ncbi:MAG: hypothetical protein ACRD40_06740 [Candidatus Acidiferrales bacterium]
MKLWCGPFFRRSLPRAGYEYTVTFYDRVTHDVIKNVTTKALETRGDAADFLQPGDTWVSRGRKFPRRATESRLLTR